MVALQHQGWDIGLARNSARRFPHECTALRERFKAMLDGLAGMPRGANHEVFPVIGHTDEIGTTYTSEVFCAPRRIRQEISDWQKHLTQSHLRRHQGADPGPLPNEASAVLGVARRRSPAGDPIAASGSR